MSTERISWMKRHNDWLSQDNRLERWNHVRSRAGKSELSLEEAAKALANPQTLQQVQGYLDGVQQ